MKISKSYQLVSGVLSVCIVLSFTLSMCSVNMLESICDQMMMDSMPEITHIHNPLNDMHHSPKADASECNMAIDCDCTINARNFGTIPVTVVLKTQPLLSLSISFVDEIQFSENTSAKNVQHFLKDSYSSPPLFLANESFLI